MRRKRKPDRKESDVGYWISFSDLMSAALIIFLLLFVFKALDYQTAINGKEEKIKQLADTRATIIKELQEKFKEDNLNIAIDPKTGSIQLSESILFDYGKNELKPEGKEFLKKFIPIYTSILFGDKKISSQVSEIIVEGHTDQNGDYLYNMKLSQERAFSVVQYFLGPDISYPYKKDLMYKLTSNGRSYSEPIVKDGKVDAAASRRVVIKFRLNEQQTLEEIQKELQAGD